MGMHGLLKDGERYELLGELASGGMATVYLARMRRPMGFSRLVAIKCMHPQFAKDPSFVSMFMDEARLTARLRHPNIVPTLDIVAEDGHLLLVMEYVEGASLAHLLRSAKSAKARIPMPIACAIVHDMLLGLHEAHQAKDDEGAPLAIIHRDISPQNVLVGLDGLARVLDFGVARARQNTHRSNDNEIKGKIPYMPPEQLFGEAIDHKVDVYAAGVTLWEALCCERLFDGPSETALVKKISEEPIALPSSRNSELPEALDAIVMRALSREAKDRYESVLAMAEAIAAVVPLPTRTEVSAWVRQYIAPREVPSGPKLSAADLAVSADPITTMLAVLEKASMLRPSSKRPSPVVQPRPQRRFGRIVVAVAVVAVAFAGVGVARVAIAHSAANTPATAKIEPLHEAALTPAVPITPAPTLARDPEPAPPPVHVAKPRAVAAPSPAEKSEKSEKAASQKPASCNIPYTIDSDGHKHYKVECI